MYNSTHQQMPLFRQSILRTVVTLAEMSSDLHKRQQIINVKNGNSKIAAAVGVSVRTVRYEI